MDLNSFSENEAEAIRLIEEGADASVPDTIRGSPMFLAAHHGKKFHQHFFSRLLLLTKIFFKATKK